MIGAEVDARSLARLFWGVHALDEAEALREYLTSLALREMEEAVTLSLPEILEKVVRSASARAKSEGIRLLEERTVDDQARNTIFLESVEEEFYAEMNEAVAKRKAEEAMLRQMAFGKEPKEVKAVVRGGKSKHKGAGKGKRR
jgi:hypothetical protein